MKKTRAVLERKPRRLIEAAINEGRKSLLEHEADELAKMYGIPLPKAGLARSENDAVKIARKIGYPIAMKIVSPEILHKTDVGGVRLGLDSRAEVKRAFAEIMKNAKKVSDKVDITGVYVQRMAEKAHEFVVGAIRDPQFGPAVMFGIGGIYVELFKDVTFRLAPLSLEEATSMTNDFKAAPLLRGFRGAKPLDVSTAARTIQAVGKMISENPQIESIDINPLLVYEKGAVAVDVRVILHKQN